MMNYKIWIILADFVNYHHHNYCVAKDQAHDEHLKGKKLKIKKPEVMPFFLNGLSTKENAGKYTRCIQRSQKTKNQCKDTKNSNHTCLGPNQSTKSNINKEQSPVDTLKPKWSDVMAWGDVKIKTQEVMPKARTWLMVS